ncbi:uncharacterized protein PAC_15886 [Phialocephala subalpina]|uniref:SET domain-containing protein n=1 Tax=Phialocephala subalpina TaxID=576137 RepID=A0A1L7XM04_9HELO|nr:uncharacterized protein PAC_15886 [Phialocephala subalpina]
MSLPLGRTLNMSSSKDSANASLPPLDQLNLNYAADGSETSVSNAEPSPKTNGTSSIAHSTTPAQTLGSSVPDRVLHCQSLLVQKSTIGSGEGVFTTKEFEDGDLIFSIKQPLLAIVRFSKNEQPEELRCVYDNCLEKSPSQDIGSKSPSEPHWLSIFHVCDGCKSALVLFERMREGSVQEPPRVGISNVSKDQDSRS